MKIGFIGCGKMARALIGGFLRQGIVTSEQLVVSAKTTKTLEFARTTLGIRTTERNEEVAREAGILFLAVPPQIYESTIEGIREYVTENTVVVSIAAGLSIAQVAGMFGKPVKIVRGMPNTPSLIGSGVTALCENEAVTAEDRAQVDALFKAVGTAEWIHESQMDSIPSIAGSSPVYVYMMIEAMADSGVKLGLGRDEAYRLAAWAVLGAARMALETGKHPAELKDGVCTPGGATIEAVMELEGRGFRGAIQAAMQRCYEKVLQLGKR